jgi:hypothetical protein
VIAMTVLALGVAQPTAAKDVREELAFSICGPSACVPLADEGPAAWLTGLLYADEPIAGPAAEPGPYYQLRISYESVDGATPIGWAMPASDAIRTQRLTTTGIRAEWYALALGVADAVVAAAGGVTPYPTPELTSVRVGDAPVPDRAAYLPLLGPLEEAFAEPPRAVPKVPITFAASRPTPWTHGTSQVTHLYSATHDALFVDREWKQVPPDLAARIEGGAAPVTPKASSASPPQPAAAPAGALPWAAIAGALGGVVLCLAAGLGLFHRVGARRGAQPA